MKSSKTYKNSSLFWSFLGILQKSSSFLRNISILCIIYVKSWAFWQNSKKIQKRLERGHKNHQKWHIRASWGVPHDRPKIEKVNGRLKKKMISFGRPDKIEKYGPLGGTPRCVIFGDFCVKTRAFFGFFLNFAKKLEFLRRLCTKSRNIRKNSSFLPKFQKKSKKDSSFYTKITKNDTSEGTPPGVHIFRFCQVFQNLSFSF